jgi:hypothetical protein
LQISTSQPSSVRLVREELAFEQNLSPVVPRFVMPHSPAVNAAQHVGCLILVAIISGCSSQVRRFPLRDPLWRDPDLNPVAVACKKDPTSKPPGELVCTPEPYESSFAWDAADNTLFRPLSRFFAVDPAGEAVNVNSFDEVPDSSWFENRMGKRSMSVAELVEGPCKGLVLDEDGPDGSWEIDQGKMNGANPGFRVRVKKTKFMLKSDPPIQPERATGATAIAARLYHAAGWHVACDSVEYVRPSLLKLRPGLTVTDNSNVSRPFDERALKEILKNAARRNGKVRMMASRWLPGRSLGPFTYDGIKKDDPNDIILHEDRRDLRGARLMAAWLNHFDSREQNTMATWMPTNPKKAKTSKGYVKHWYIDLGDCFGSEWDWEGISKRLGHAYYLDIPYLLEDFLTLGLQVRPWDRAKHTPGAGVFGYFDSKDFEPAGWHGGYPNPAFARMSEADGAWFARILARFTKEHVEAAVGVGNYTDPFHSRFLIHHLLVRQAKILTRYLGKLSPLADVAMTSPDTLCANDLAYKSGLFAKKHFRYSAVQTSGDTLDHHRALTPSFPKSGRVCVQIPHVMAESSAAKDDPQRYVLVEIRNAQAPGPLVAHLYDLGPKLGFRLVGIERPSN